MMVFSNFSYSLELFAFFLFQDKKNEPVRLEDITDMEK